MWLRSLMLSSIFLVLALLIAGPAPQGHPQDLAQLELRRVQSAMMYPGVENTKLEWRYCLEPNAFYSPKDNAVYICHELVDEAKATMGPEWAGVIRSVVAHELAHAVIYREQIPITGSEEAAADELANMTMMAAGMQADVLSLARYWYYTWSVRPQINMTLSAEHPAGVERARAAVCLLAGQDRSDADCVRTWQRVQRNWRQLLKVHGA